jgi:hypothetical protein
MSSVMKEKSFITLTTGLTRKYQTQLLKGLRDKRADL